MTHTEALEELRHVRADVEQRHRFAQRDSGLRNYSAEAQEDRRKLDAFFDRRLTALALAMDALRDSGKP